MGDDRPRRQPALLSQIVAEPRKYPILWSDWRLWCRCDHIRLAQHRQKPLQRRPVTRLEALLLPPVLKIPFGHALIEMGQLQLASLDPIQEISHYVQAPPSSVTG
jgi:hypothetical protein